MKQQHVFFLFLFLIGSANLICQEKWDVQKCMDYAIENNISINRQQLYVDYSRVDHIQAKVQLAPSINSNIGHNYNIGNSLNNDQYSYTNESFINGNMGLNARVNLFRGFYNYNNLQKTRLDMQVNQQDLEKLKFDLKLDVLAAYLQVLFDKSVLELAKEQKELTDLEVEKIETLVGAGAKAKGDLVEMQAQQAKDNAAIVDAKNNIELSYLTLKMIMNLPFEEEFEIKKPKTELLVYEVDDSLSRVYERAVEFYPGILSAKYALESSKKLLNMSASGATPSVSLGYNYSTRYNELSYQAGETYPDQVLNNIYNGLYLSISMPIFNNLSNWKNIRQAEIGIKDAALNLDLEKKELNEEIKRAYADAIAAHSSYKAKTALLEAAELSFQNIREKYDAGIVTSTEYKTEMNNLNKVKSDLLKAKYQFVFTKAVLDFYSGGPVSLN
jgi:outer membrane protein